jgi:hypothetical protein
MSHFLATSGTDDYAYYQANCKKLAINNPGLAVNNADSHEFIAENTPSLSCAAGVSNIPILTNEPILFLLHKHSHPSPHHLKPSSPCLGMDVEVSIKTDEYPGETTWTLSDSCGTGRTLSGGPYSQANSLISVKECLPAGKYVFTINDAEGDGLCCGFGTGWYNVVVNGVTTYAGGLFGGSETKTFGECAVSLTRKSSACHYYFVSCSEQFVSSFTHEDINIETFLESILETYLVKAYCRHHQQANINLIK